MRNSDIVNIERLVTNYADSVGDDITEHIPDKIPYSTIADLINYCPETAIKINLDKSALANLAYYLDQSRLVKTQAIPEDWIKLDEFFNTSDTDGFKYRLNLMNRLATEFYDYFDKSLNVNRTARDILFNSDGSYRDIGYKNHTNGSTYTQVEKYQRYANRHSKSDNVDVIEQFLSQLASNSFSKLKRRLNLSDDKLSEWVDSIFNAEDGMSIDELTDDNGRPITGFQQQEYNVFNNLRYLYQHMTHDEQRKLLTQIQYKYN